MNMNKKGIENRTQLLAEIERLKKEADVKKSKVSASVAAVKENLRMENIIVNAISSVTGVNINKKEFLKNGIAMGLTMVLQRFVFKTETNLERKVYSWIDSFFDQLKFYINKFSPSGSVRSEKIEEQE